MRILLKNLLLIACCLSQTQAFADERSDIAALLRELEYLRERVEAMAQKNSENTAKIRFNYRALLEQMQVTENGIRAYLNAQIDTIHLTPPKPVDSSLYGVRRN
ncbi:RAQPRD family integrative conjugative element protein [Suttonella indologenes]|uniref:Integrative conjugative element protein, RAQPRD family n=1 Tax=Suttonella indologenes TaxID=13276 RepID=A0A380MJH8_9GAMM|nr:RAQPRD family integrative conjugative element protein [Suttonella indologenes]SUO90282.1 integrative conjugative element protein, RAQPRD family [Suttonella indologenes]